MQKSELDELIALYHGAKSAVDTLREAIEAQAEQQNISKTALRKVVTALAEGKADKLDEEAREVLALLESEPL